MTSAVCNRGFIQGIPKGAATSFGPLSLFYLVFILNHGHKTSSLNAYFHLLSFYCLPNLQSCPFLDAGPSVISLQTFWSISGWSASDCPSGAGPGFPEADVCGSSILTQTVQLAFGEHGNSKYNTENEDRNHNALHWKMEFSQRSSLGFLTHD